MLSTSFAGYLVDLLDRPARRAGQFRKGWSADRNPSDRGPTGSADASVRPTINSARIGMSFDRM